MSTPASSSTIGPRGGAVAMASSERPRRSAATWLAILFFAGALLFGGIAMALGDVFYLRLATEALIFGGLALSVRHGGWNTIDVHTDTAHPEG